MRLLICAGRHFKDAGRLCLALDQCHGLQPVALLGHLLHAGGGLPDEAGAGAASVARIRAPTIIRSAVAATTPCASMARPSSAMPRRTCCWCFPVGAWPAN
ncbi:hypothetical protein P4054_30260 [Pseudomonas aeruginosa]|nr:hypothetical protein [Pseudomonas aeruginosa]